MQLNSPSNCGTMAASKESEVRVELLELNAVQDRLGKAILEMYDRLRSVLRENPEIAENCKDTPEKTVVQLAEEIRSARKKAELMVSSVYDIVRRCEL